MTFTLDDLSVPAPDPSDLDWNEDGFLVIPRLVPDDLIDEYCSDWEAEHMPDGNWQDATRGGWAYATPYMQVPSLRFLATYPGIQAAATSLIGEQVGLHLNLTGWVSTQRDWHQDTYLNPPHVKDYYVAVWIALDDIKPDAGPFQMVAGSHRWMEVTQERMFRALTPEEVASPLWPQYSERILTPLFEQEIERRQAPVIDYLPKRGDVLFWHSRLLHRGSRPTNPDAVRKALICHYSGVKHRQDMPTAKVGNNGGVFFPLDGRQPTR